MIQGVFHDSLNNVRTCVMFTAPSVVVFRYDTSFAEAFHTESSGSGQTYVSTVAGSGGAGLDGGGGVLGMGGSGRLGLGGVGELGGSGRGGGSRLGGVRQSAPEKPLVHAQVYVTSTDWP